VWEGVCQTTSSAPFGKQVIFCVFFFLKKKRKEKKKKKEK
jgi:hypothetical protein